MVAAAVRKVFEEAKRCASTQKAQGTLTPNNTHYWSIYLTALDNVALRCGDKDLAAEIVEYRTAFWKK